jgi:hypothetical protein
MAEEVETEGARPGVPVLFDERDIKHVYSNAYLISALSDEVIIDLGFNMPTRNPQSGQPQVVLKITDRVVMNYMNAKRLALSLGQLVKRYEQQFGELIPSSQRAQQNR